MSEARIIALQSRQIGSLFALGSAALLITGVQPILIGTLIESRFAGLQGAGYLATAETIALWAGIALATAFFPTNAFRRIGALALIILAGANAASAVAPSFEILIFCRLFTGFAGGVLLWIVTSMIVRTPRPDRISGYFMAGYTLVQSLTVVLLAVYFVPHFGWRGCFGLLAAVTAVPLAFVWNIPGSLAPLPHAHHETGRLSMPVVLAGLIAFLQIIATITIWAFLDPIGRLTGATPQTVQLVISASLVVQIAGAAIAAALSGHLAARTTHFVGTAILVLIALIIINASRTGPAIFVCTAFAFSFLWMFILPFQVKLAMEVDPSGRLALNIPSLQIAGGAFAPTAAGMVAGNGPSSNVAWLSLWCAVATMGVLAALAVPGPIRGPGTIKPPTGP